MVLFSGPLSCAPIELKPTFDISSLASIKKLPVLGMGLLFGAGGLYLSRKNGMVCDETFNKFKARFEKMLDEASSALTHYGFAQLVFTFIAGGLVDFFVALFYGVLCIFFAIVLYSSQNKMEQKMQKEGEV